METDERKVANILEGLLEKDHVLAILVQLSVSQFSYKLLGVFFPTVSSMLAYNSSETPYDSCLPPPSFPLRQEFHNAASGWS